MKKIEQIIKTPDGYELVVIPKEHYNQLLEVAAPILQARAEAIAEDGIKAEELAQRDSLVRAFE
jgi:hypothetical protein